LQLFLLPIKFQTFNHHWMRQHFVKAAISVFTVLKFSYFLPLVVRFSGLDARFLQTKRGIRRSGKFLAFPAATHVFYRKCASGLADREAIKIGLQFLILKLELGGVSILRFAACADNHVFCKLYCVSNSF